MADDMEKKQQPGGQPGQHSNPPGQSGQNRQPGQGGQPSGQPGQPRKGPHDQDEQDNENLDRQRRAS